MSNSPFSIIQADHIWINPATGKPTQAFFRLILNLYLQSGGGATASAADVATAYFATSQSAGGPDRDSQIADLLKLVMTQPSTAGRIAALEQRVADLSQQLAIALRKPPDSTNMQKQIDTLTALVQATH